MRDRSLTNLRPSNSLGPTVDGDPTVDTQGLVPILAEDPTADQLPEHYGLLYLSDGSTDVTGAAGDLVVATLDEGTVDATVSVSNVTDATLDGGLLEGTVSLL